MLRKIDEMHRRWGILPDKRCEDCYWYATEQAYCIRFGCHARNDIECVNWKPQEPPKEADNE